jgi:hypothetical protein
VLVGDKQIAQLRRTMLSAARELYYSSSNDLACIRVVTKRQNLASLFKGRRHCFDELRIKCQITRY